MKLLKYITAATFAMTFIVSSSAMAQQPQKVKQDPKAKVVHHKKKTKQSVATERLNNAELNRVEAVNGKVVVKPTETKPVKK